MKIFCTVLSLFFVSVSVLGQPIMNHTVLVRLQAFQTEAQIRTWFPIQIEQLTPMMVVNEQWSNKYKSSQAPYKNNEMLQVAKDKLTRTWTIRYAGTMSPSLMANWLLQKYPMEVEVAEPKYIYEVQGTPNDPMAPQQQAFVVTRMLQAWGESEGAADVVIGIVDNGVEQTHEDLAGNIRLNTGEIPNNDLDDDNNGFVDDYAGCNLTYLIDNTKPGDTKNNAAGGHGTRVAGIASAQTNNGKGIAGFGFACPMIPVKTGPLTGGITHGYEGILYAVSRGCKVVNTSWGLVKPPSPVEQSVIDFCVASDVLIVASGGNHGNGATGSGWKQSNYPASYVGVFGVAETNLQDAVTYSSGLGYNVQLAAPGLGALSTSPGNLYDATSGGTSFCSPMVAGVAGLLRARHPFLTAMQIAALLRISGVDIGGKNAGIADFVPKRLDAYAALRLDPTSTPGVRVVEIERRKNGVIVDRMRIGDTIAIRYLLKNELSTVNNLNVDVKIADQADWSAQVIDGIQEIAKISMGESVWSNDVLLHITQMGVLPLSLRIDLSSGSYTDVAFDLVRPSSTMATMQNERLVYSIGDDGKLAYNSNGNSKAGLGFNWKDEFALMSYSGLIVSASTTHALKGFDNLTEISDFSVKKAFVAPDRQTNVMDDSSVLPQRMIGLEVTQTCTFPGASADATVIAITVRNRSGSAISDVAVGYYLDVDIGSSGVNNTVRLAPEAIPSGMNGAVAMAFQRADVDVSVVQAVHSASVGVIPQAAGMLLNSLVDDGDGFTDADVIRLLSSGTSIQTVATGDMCSASGIRFPGLLMPNETKTMILVVGVGTNATEAATVVRNTLANPMSVFETELQNTTNVYPNPANNVIVIEDASDVLGIAIVDVNGIVVKNIDARNAIGNVISIADLPNGFYTLIIHESNKTTTKPLAVIH